jgi:alcohol dehydrogenase
LTTGTPHESERTLEFTALTGVLTPIDVVPLEKACEACRRMKSGDVKLGMALTMLGAGEVPR